MASAPNWPPASTASASTTWMRRSSGWAVPRCRCRTPSRSSWPRCRSRPRSNPQPALCWQNAASPDQHGGSVSEELVMPRLSDTMEEGTIGRWLVHEGDSFNEGDVLAEIETDKALMEFQAYDAGTVLKILVDDGESAALGSPIAIVGEAGEEVPEQAKPADQAKAASEAPADQAKPEPEAKPAAKRSKATSKAPAAATNGSGGGTATLKVSPIARRMADQAGIDLTQLAGRGSGPEGRVVKADVERLIDGGVAPAPAKPSQPAAPQPAAVADDAELRDLKIGRASCRE